jgi:DNA repair exonuclease SbcCD nuclease subunit
MTNSVEFIVFSDIQIEDWKRHSINHRRLHLNFDVLKKVYGLCLKYKCPALFCGDLFDNPKSLDNYVLNYVFMWFNKFRDADIPIYAISGNHDQSASNFMGKESPSYIQMMSTIYPNFYNLDFKTRVHGQFDISGIPFITSNVNFKVALEETRKRLNSNKKHILLIHTDLWGAKDSMGRIVDSVQNIPQQLEKFFKGFDLVLCGHIHKPQVLRARILMVGATHQQRVSDMGTDMKIWKVFSTLRYKSISTNQPRFVYDDGATDDYNFYLDRPKETKEIESTTVTNFRSHNPVVLAKNFLKANKIKSKPKLNILIKHLKDAGE